MITMRREQKYYVQQHDSDSIGVYDKKTNVVVCYVNMNVGTAWQRARRICGLLNADYHSRRLANATKRRNKLNASKLEKALQEIQRECQPRKKDTRKYFLD